jgi:uncharacterized protein YbjT (DUF2867 family)
MIPDGFTVVAGSLGDQGGSAARTLKLHGRHVRVLSHDRRSPAASGLLEAGVEVVSDDLEAPEVVVRDLAGAAHVFAALTPFDEGGPRAELREVRNLAWASVRAGVEQFVFSSVGDPEHDQGLSGGELWSAERLLQQFDLPLTLLRPALFMENVDRFALRRGPGGGLVLRTPLPEKTVVPLIALEDVGTLVRVAFDRPGVFGLGPVSLVADERSFAEVRALLSEALGEPIRYEQIAFGEVKDRRARGMYRWFQTSARSAPDVKKLRRLHPGLQTLQQWVEGGGLDLERIEHVSAAAAA